MTPATDPRAIVDQAPMSRFQWAAVATLVGLNALDGFDVLAVSFASPGIAKQWGIDRAALGFVLSMELIGMALGSLVLGNLADRLGRRRLILGCLAVMATGMFGASLAKEVVTLSLWRVFTGLGIGGMLAATNAAVAEVANARRRSLSIVLMATGYPVGAVVGGGISAQLLRAYDWQAVFVFGACVTLAFVPLVLWLIPESIAFTMTKRGPGALASVNTVLRRMRQPPLDELPPGDPVAKGPLAQLFAPPLIATTLLLAAAYFFHVITFYFILKWIPKLVSDLGFDPSSAAGVLVWANVGGASGCLLLGLLSQRLPTLTLTVVAMLASVVLVTLFGRAGTDIANLSMVAAAAGFCTNAAIVGLYALMGQMFPAPARATGTGIVIGIGRGGSAVAPAIGGLLFAAGYSLPVVAMMMAVGSLIGAAALVTLRQKRTAFSL